MALKKEEIKSLSQKILKASSFIFTTHKSCDADGLGSVIAFHHLMKQQGRKVQSISVDEVPQRYDFMNHKGIVEVYEESKTKIKPADLALIFDTNDYRLIEPLYSELKKKAKEIIFIDHHCPIENLSSDIQLYVDENSASTGELCFLLMEEMKLPIHQEVAKAIYISIIFDTHMFRSSKNLSKAFYTCSKLCQQVDVNDIYEKLFCHYDQQTWTQMLNMLNNIKYNSHQNVAIMECSYKHFQQSSLTVFHILDCLDLVMKRKSVLVGFASIETKPGQFKLSFRSKKPVDISKMAESLGGGGHQRSAGVTVAKYSREDILDQVHKILLKAS